MRIQALLGGLVLAVAMAGATAVQAQTNVLFIFDASGSMKRDAGGGESRMVAAKRAIADTLRSLPAASRLGLMVYGHRRSKDCTDIELVSPIASEDAGTLARYVGALEAKGETPIAEALTRAGKSFAAFKGQSNRIVLVTDGIEECRGDPCAAARNLVGLGVDLKVDVVGFTLTEVQRKLIQCVPDITGGRYYDARDARALQTTLAQVQETISKPAPSPARFNLISQKNGGVLLLAPNDGWLSANDDVEKAAGNEGAVGAQAVFAFRDEKPATFDTFAVHVAASAINNLRKPSFSSATRGRPASSARSPSALSSTRS
ncbi:MAG: VWA domain-containing protein [Xanthobacteraceae bacterium]|nr:VWA domain-containing protein [Xanthobacteraceae bacterium]